MKVRLPPAVVRVIGPALVRLLASTWRFPQPMPPPLERARAGAGALVVVLWHEELLPLLWRFRGCGFGAVVSEARDGQYVADAARQFGYLPIRGSSRRGAGKALLGAIRALQEGTTVAFTPDGPVGPRRQLKQGAIAAAQTAGVPVLAVRVSASRSWRARSWDRFLLPKPFATLQVRYAGPFTVGAGEEGLAAGMREVTEALNLLGDD